MKRIIVCFLLAISFFVFLSACDLNAYHMPTSYPNTRWVSQDPDMFFIIGENINGEGLRPYADVTYAQINIDEEVIELIVGFRHSQMFVDNPARRDPETGGLLPGRDSNYSRIFIGSGRFSPDRVVIRITHNPNGFLDDSIEEIIFYREDIE